MTRKWNRNQNLTDGCFRCAKWQNSSNESRCFHSEGFCGSSIVSLAAVSQNQFTMSSGSQEHRDNSNEDCRKMEIKWQIGYKLGRLTEFGKGWQKTKNNRPLSWPVVL
jgi:hypothetical protein